VLIEVGGAPANEIRKRLEQVAGVARVVSRESRNGVESFEVQGLENYTVRPELARAVVQSGWNLTEMRAIGESLEEIFLELTRSEESKAPSEEGKEGNLVAQ
jgi:ABC-2 type transport system ATP-binding protein